MPKNLLQHASDFFAVNPVEYVKRHRIAMVREYRGLTIAVRGLTRAEGFVEVIATGKSIDAVASKLEPQYIPTDGLTVIGTVDEIVAGNYRVVERKPDIICVEQARELAEAGYRVSP